MNENSDSSPAQSRFEQTLAECRRMRASIDAESERIQQLLKTVRGITAPAERQEEAPSLVP